MHLKVIVCKPSMCFFKFQMSTVVLTLGMPFLKTFSGPKKGDGVSVSLQQFPYKVLICAINGKKVYLDMCSTFS